MKKENSYRGFQNAWWVVLAAFFVLTASSALTSVLTEYFHLKPFSAHLSMLVGEAAFIIPAILGLVSAKKLTPYYSAGDILGFHSFDPRILLFMLILPYCAQSYFTAAAAPLNGLLAFVFGTHDEITMLFPKSISQMIMLFTTLCILAPVLEELLFRGAVIHMLDRYGNVFAVTVSAAMFALLHFDPAGIVIYFALGMLLGLIRYTSGSVIPCIIMHAANNFIGFMQIIFFKELDFIYGGGAALFASGGVSPAAVLYAVIQLLTAAAFPFLLLWMLKILKTKINFTKPYARPGISAGAVIFSVIISVSCIFSLFTNGIFKNIAEYISSEKAESSIIPFGDGALPFDDYDDYEDSIERFFKDYYGG